MACLPTEAPPKRSLRRRIAVLLATGSLIAVVPADASEANGLAFDPAHSAARTSIYDGYSYAGHASSSYGGRWNIYEGYTRVGYVRRSFGGRWNVYEGYSRVGYVKRSYGNRWNVYEGYSRIGYVRKSYSRRSNVYSGYSQAAYVRGGNGGPVGGAALLLGLMY